MPSKLEQLRAVVAQAFENATSKEQIEQVVKINQTIDEVEQEQKDLIDQNADLIKSYKELIKHTSFREAPKVDTPTSVPPSLEESLRSYLASHPEEN